MTKKSSGFKMRGFSGFGEGTSPLKGATTTTGLENLSSLSGGGDTGGGGSDSGTGNGNEGVRGSESAG